MFLDKQTYNSRFAEPNGSRCLQQNPATRLAQNKMLAQREGLQEGLEPDRTLLSHALHNHVSCTG